MYRLTVLVMDETDAAWAARLLKQMDIALSTSYEEIKVVEAQHMPANFLATAEMLAPTKERKVMDLQSNDCPVVGCRIIGKHNHHIDGPATNAVSMLPRKR